MHSLEGPTFARPVPTRAIYLKTLLIVKKVTFCMHAKLGNGLALLKNFIRADETEKIGNLFVEIIAK